MSASNPYITQIRLCAVCKDIYSGRTCSKILVFFLPLQLSGSSLNYSIATPSGKEEPIPKPLHFESQVGILTEVLYESYSHHNIGNKIFLYIYN
jgi:hypothetical protein